MKDKVFRIIDANLNRSREGLRVCEDIARFGLNSRTLAQELKSVRHSISASAIGFAGKLKELSASRDSEEDVLKSSRLDSEMKRRTFADIFAANIERVKESLRVMEELFKLINVKGSSKFRNLRFKIYTIEKKAMKRLYDAD